MREEKERREGKMGKEGVIKLVDNLSRKWKLKFLRRK